MSLVPMLTTPNVGPLDRLLRVLPAVATAWLWWNGTLTGYLAGGVAVISAMLLVTSLTGACSIYYMLGASTCARRDTRE